MARRFESRVFFPWERKRGIVGILERARARMILVACAVIALVVLVRRREGHAASVRATRTTITTVERAVSSFRADHAGKCPGAISDLVNGGYAHDVPLDAWGRPLRVTCPGRRDPTRFEV